MEHHGGPIVKIVGNEDNSRTMRLELRQFAIPVLLAFVLGIASVNAHASTHLLADAYDCDLCSTYSNPPASPAAEAFLFSEFRPSVAACQRPPQWTENEIVERLFARGPPRYS